MKSKLQEKRKEKGLTQKELSEATNIPKRTIINLENKQNKIDNTNIKTLLELCDALDCKIEDILEEPENHRLIMRVIYKIKA